MVEVLQDFALEGQSKYEIAVSFAGVLDGLLEAFTLHHTPYTLNPTPYTHPTP